ncbi:hypothetical protein ACEN4P_08445 [Marinilactibacillus psychrotolerans]|nr:hypothetical protein [Marinilactibacillus psychrotolerans]TLQ06092.1 hypothetical protein FEZ48_11185 [Marinilactibacillus psychrotolerans]SDC76198.1 hypothetical protein SAMN04488013_10925 [Marinilactibacillus psychrotolerans]SJN45398.1 hypothetical protein FM115_11105 [Marinilactibacillus psychrotolerans 42ea]GEL67015.1 hypothetical protein MPS01_11700 [Marinilactibacillus psychrotolerans]GEQ34379.1 hypothetical protein B795N_22610 [Marinilactibacillus psychrotolerans]
MSKIKNMKFPDHQSDYGTFQLNAMADLFFKYKIESNGEPRLLPEFLLDDSVYFNNKGLYLNPNSVLFNAAEKDLNNYFEKNKI